MFHVSSISGSQVPYDPDTFQVLRAEASRVQSVEALAATEAASTERVSDLEHTELFREIIEDSTLDDAAIDETTHDSPGISIGTSAGSSQHPGPDTPQAVGLAAASLHPKAITRQTEQNAEITDVNAATRMVNPAAAAKETVGERAAKSPIKNLASRLIATYGEKFAEKKTRVLAITAEQIMSSPVKTLLPSDSVEAAWVDDSPTSLPPCPDCFSRR